MCLIITLSLLCVNFARNVFHVDRLTKKKKKRKGQLKKKKRQKLFISIIKLFINLLYKGSFYTVPGRKGREVKHKPQLCTCLHCSVPQEQIPQFVGRRETPGWAEVWHHILAVSHQPAWAGSPGLHSLHLKGSEQTKIQQKACLCRSPFFHSPILFHSKIAKASLAVAFSRGAKTTLFLQGWSKTSPTWSDLSQRQAQNMDQVPSWQSSLHLTPSVAPLTPSTLIIWLTSLWENNQFLPPILSTNSV